MSNNKTALVNVFKGYVVLILNKDLRANLNLWPWHQRSMNKTLITVSSSEPWMWDCYLTFISGNPELRFLISPLVHTLSSYHLDIWHGGFSWWDTERLLHYRKRTQSLSGGPFAIWKAHNGAHWKLPVLASHVLWRGQSYLCNSPLKTCFLLSTMRRICLTLREPCTEITAFHNGLYVHSKVTGVFLFT